MHVQMQKRITSLYAITFPNGKKYIGLSVDPKERFRQHKKETRRGHSPLNRAIAKYGKDQISMCVLCVGERDYIQDLEVKAIAAFETQLHINGYNISSGGESGASGVKKTEEQKRLLAERMKGNSHTKGMHFKHKNPRTDAQREAASILRIGKPSAAKGCKHPPRSEEYLAALSKRLIGNKHTLGMSFPKSESDRAKMSEIAYARWADPIWKAEELARRKSTKTGKVENE